MKDLMDLLQNPEEYMLQGGGEYEIISELSLLRTLIRYQNYRLVVYGAGARGSFLVGWLKKENISVEFVLDENSEKAGTCVKGVMVYGMDAHPVLKNDRYIALVSPYIFERDDYERDKITKKLYEHGVSQIMYPFHSTYGLAPYRYKWAEYYQKNSEKLLQMYQQLQDDTSRDTVYEYIKAILTNQVYRGEQRRTLYKYWECYEPLKEEVLLDVGACVGDSLFYFIENYQERFKRIIAVEGDEYVCNNRLKNNLKILPEKLRERVKVLNIYLNKNTVEYLQNETFSLIKMDVEGCELEILQSLKDKIVANRPVLAICAYHKPEDLIELTGFVEKNLSEYVILFRKYAAPYSNHLENGELVMYAVPKERH